MEPGSRPPLILTVTPNPSLDLLYTAGTLVRDDANRIADPRVRPGGQGLNVARAVAALGGRAVAVTLLGGSTGDRIRRILAAEPVRLEAAEAVEPTRVFVSVFETGTGQSLNLNSPGPARSPADQSAVADRVAAALRAGPPAWVACCGSLPIGFDPDFYRTIGRAARDHGALFVPDCDGPALAAAVRDGCDLLVPNRHEAGRLTGLPVPDPGAAAVAARRLLGTARLGAAVTMGADGAVLATPDGVWHAVPGAPLSGTAVGAGDAFLAGLLLALSAGDPPDRALARGVAAGTATLLSGGAALVEAGAAERLLPATRVRRLETSA